MQRLTLFHFYESDGIIRRHEEYLLREIASVSSCVITIVNGFVTEDTARKINRISSSLYIRENTGFDAMGYKDIINFHGRSELLQYDEIFLINNSCFGPLCPMQEIFDKMEDKQCDFWGMLEMPIFPAIQICSEYSDDGFTKSYLQSNFLVFRKNVAHSIYFETFFNSMPLINSYSEAQKFFEFELTKYFNKSGFEYLPYLDTKELQGQDSELYEYLNATRAHELVEIGFPFIKKVVFELAVNYIDFERKGDTNARKLLEYVRQKTYFDYTMITDIFAEAQNKTIFLKKNIFLYGAGVIAASVRSYLLKNNIDISGFITSKDEGVKTIGSTPVYPFDQWLNKFSNSNDYVIVLAMSSINQKQVKAKLKAHGLTEQNIY